MTKQNNSLIFVLNNNLVLKTLFVTYLPVLKFIGVFAVVYFSLSMGYQTYLTVAQKDIATPDVITALVASQATTLLTELGYYVQLAPDPSGPFMNLYMDGVHRANIVEGCNGVSIIILFIAFVLAFAQGLKKTFLFLLAGSVLIYVMNIIRIGILSIAIKNYPHHQEVLHQLVFPGIIYGTVVLLWFFWVRIVSKNKVL